MDPQQAFCSNAQCPARGQVGKGNVRIHSLQEQRYRCTVCGKTFSARQGTVFFRCRVESHLITLIVTLLAYGCPIAAIEAAFGFQARTVRRWQQEAGAHCKQVQHHLVQRPQSLGQVQADELRVRAQKQKSGGATGGVCWMALALAVPTRLWLGGVVSQRRDKALIQALARQVRTCARPEPLLLAVDGLSSYIKAFQQVFRSPQHQGQAGRPRLVAWPEVVIGRVIKVYGVGRGGRRLVEEVRRVLAQGTPRQLVALLRATQDKGQGRGTLNTAFIERLNATFRARLAPLARRTRALARQESTLRAGMYLVGAVYNFCSCHASLTLPDGTRRTPAMAAGLSDHCWSVRELLWYRMPPAPWRPTPHPGPLSKSERELMQRWAT